MARQAPTSLFFYKIVIYLPEYIQSLTLNPLPLLHALWSGSHRDLLCLCLWASSERRRRPRGLGPGGLAAHLRSGLGWEAAGGAAWDVQSDGQLLQLVQAVAGTRQVGWSQLARCLPRGGGQLRPKEGAPPLLSASS